MRKSKTQTRKITAIRDTSLAVTHEPESPHNWPDGHVNIRQTPDDYEDECFVITIHGVDHYLHATTAYELYKKMTVAIEAWDVKAKAAGQPGVIGVD